MEAEKHCVSGESYLHGPFLSSVNREEETPILPKGGSPGSGTSTYQTFKEYTSDIL